MKNLIAILCLCALAACTPGRDYLITGTWENGDDNLVYLQKEIEIDSFQTVDSAAVRAGAFRFEGKTKNIERWKLAAGPAKKEIIIDDVPITVTITNKVNSRTGKEVPAITVAGSIEQQILEEGNNLVITKNFMTLGGMLMMMQVKDDSLKLDSTYRSVETIKAELDKQIHNFLDTTAGYHASVFLILNVAVKEFPFREVEQYYQRLTPRVKNSIPGRRLGKIVEGLKQVNIGGLAPEIELPSPDGSPVKLSSLRGRYVLVDFWASWCGPCIAEVPNVKAVYEKYRDKGFEIFGVSLDDKADRWIAAIKQHGLDWVHGSSLAGWKCPVAARYNVTGIPRTLLLDKEGRVIAIDLRGEELGKRVAALFE
ncbi:MAG: AhpC/TSA family protein [Odoribacteraceae bacterium]|jgi:thiol-disulfide isomerase/thioredoxin|nr:AhpC/TSA family protein [Odoribacteraceae bacterium]